MEHVRRVCDNVAVAAEERGWCLSRIPVEYALPELADAWARQQAWQIWRAMVSARKAHVEEQVVRFRDLRSTAEGAALWRYFDALRTSAAASAGPRKRGNRRLLAGIFGAWARRSEAQAGLRAEADGRRRCWEEALLRCLWGSWHQEHRRSANLALLLHALGERVERRRVRRLLFLWARMACRSAAASRALAARRLPLAAAALQAWRQRFWNLRAQRRAARAAACAAMVPALQSWRYATLARRCAGSLLHFALCTWREAASGCRRLRELSRALQAQRAAGLRRQALRFLCQPGDRRLAAVSAARARERALAPSLRLWVARACEARGLAAAEAAALSAVCRSRLLTSLRHLRERTRRARKRASCRMDLEESTAVSLARRVLLQWRLWAAQEARRGRLARTQWQRSGHRLLGRALRCWHVEFSLVARDRRREPELARLWLALWRRTALSARRCAAVDAATCTRLLRLVCLEWRAGSTLAADRRRESERLIACCKARRRLCALHAWRSLTVRSGHERQVGTLIEVATERRAAAGALAGWRRWTGGSQHRAQQAAELRASLAAQRQASGLRSWRRAAAVVRIPQLRDAIEARLHREAMEELFRRLVQGHTRFEQAVTALAVRRPGVLELARQALWRRAEAQAEAVGEWRTWAQDHRRQNRRRHAAASLRRDRLLRRVMCAWDAARALGALRTARHALVRRFRAADVGGDRAAAFGCWWHCAQDSRRERLGADLARAWRGRGVLQRSWRGWTRCSETPRSGYQRAAETRGRFKRTKNPDFRGVDSSTF